MGYLLVERWHAVYIGKEGKEMTQQTQRGIKVIEVNKI